MGKNHTSEVEPGRKTRVRVRRPVADPRRPLRAGVEEERALITGPRAGSAVFGYDGFCQSTDRGGEDATDHQPKTTYLQPDPHADRRFLDQALGLRERCGIAARNVRGQRVAGRSVADDLEDRLSVSSGRFVLERRIYVGETVGRMLFSTR